MVTTKSTARPHLTGATANGSGRPVLGPKDISRSRTGHRLGPLQLSHHHDTSMLYKLFATRFQKLWQLFCWPMAYRYFQQWPIDKRKAMNNPEDAIWVFLTGRGKGRSGTLLQKLAFGIFERMTENSKKVPAMSRAAQQFTVFFSRGGYYSTVANVPRLPVEARPCFRFARFRGCIGSRLQPSLLPPTTPAPPHVSAVAFLLTFATPPPVGVLPTAATASPTTRCPPSTLGPTPLAHRCGCHLFSPFPSVALLHPAWPVSL